MIIKCNKLSNVSYCIKTVLLLIFILYIYTYIIQNQLNWIQNKNVFYIWNTDKKTVKINLLI